MSRSYSSRSSCWMRRSTNECLFGTVTTQSVCEDSPTPGLSQSCYTCFSDSKKYQNCKALNYNCRDAILSISDVTKVSWRSYLQKKLFKSTCELEWKGHIFQNKNFHFNPRLKKVHVLVNGILQFTHFMPLGCFFFYSVCSYHCLHLWERPSTWQIHANCLLMSVVQSTPSCCLSAWTQIWYPQGDSTRSVASVKSSIRVVRKHLCTWLRSLSSSDIFRIQENR